MRELNPRAWIPSLNRYATGFDNLYYHRQMNREGEWWCYPAGEDEPLDVEIELPTGLKDKNGKKIYEGDIVRYGHRLRGIVPPEIRTEIVSWQSGEEEYYPCCTTSGFSLPYSEDGYEVIGNVHETPELLVEVNDVD